MKIAALLLAALCAVGAAQAETPKRGGVLRVAMTADPTTLDCHAGTSFIVPHFLAPHYSTLLRFDAERYPEIVGDLAASWTVSDDRLTYRFALRPNVKFHDGAPLTSADIKASYDRLRAPPTGVISPRAPTLASIDTIETPDALTVVFRLRQPDAAILTLLASPNNCIYSAARLAQDMRDPEKTVMGTGPFKLVRYERGGIWVGARNPDYFIPGQPYLDGFENILTTTGAAMVNALQGGQVDAEFRGITPPEVARLVQALGDKVKTTETQGLTPLTLSFNTTRPPFDDPRVRRALSIAIDRWGGSEALSRLTQLKPVGGFLRPGYALAMTTEELQQQPGFGPDMARNRETARALLREAGHANLKFALLNRSVPTPYQALGVFLVDQWRQIGVTAEHQVLEIGLQVNAMGAGNFDVTIDFASDYADEPTLQWARYLSRDRAAINSARYNDRVLDELYDRQRGLDDPKARIPLLRAFETRLLDQAYVVPLLWFRRTTLQYGYVKGWHQTPSFHVGQDLATVWLDK